MNTNEHDLGHADAITNVKHHRNVEEHQQRQHFGSASNSLRSLSRFNSSRSLRSHPRRSPLASVATPTTTHTEPEVWVTLESSQMARDVMTSGSSLANSERL